jgi:hypothetical protein
MKGIALDPLAWQPLIEAQSEWFEVIHLYGTEGGWNKLKTLVDAHEDADARHQAFVDRIAPAVRKIHAYFSTFKTFKLRMPLEIIAPPPYGRGHDDDSFHPDFDPRLPHS